MPGTAFREDSPHELLSYMQFSRYESGLYSAMQIFELFKNLHRRLNSRASSSLPALKRDAGSHLLSHAVSSVVPSAAQALTVVFGMGTGVSPARIATSNS